jgi:hypothetical protein
LWTAAFASKQELFKLLEEDEVAQGRSRQTVLEQAVQIPSLQGTCSRGHFSLLQEPLCLT